MTDAAPHAVGGLERDVDTVPHPHRGAGPGHGDGRYVRVGDGVQIDAVVLLLAGLDAVLVRVRAGPQARAGVTGGRAPHGCGVTGHPVRGRRPAPGIDDADGPGGTGGEPETRHHRAHHRQRPLAALHFPPPSAIPPGSPILPADRYAGHPDLAAGGRRQVFGHEDGLRTG